MDENKLFLTCFLSEIDSENITRIRDLRGLPSKNILQKSSLQKYIISYVKLSYPNRSQSRMVIPDVSYKLPSHVDIWIERFFLSLKILHFFTKMIVTPFWFNQLKCLTLHIIEFILALSDAFWILKFALVTNISWGSLRFLDVQTLCLNFAKV